MAKKTKRAKTYEFRRHDESGKVTHRRTRKFQSITKAENYGWLQGFDEMIMKSTYQNAQQ